MTSSDEGSRSSRSSKETSVGHEDEHANVLAEDPVVYNRPPPTSQLNKPIKAKEECPENDGSHDP